ncbi:hypothetical protein [Microseira wollei]|uniref:hypothetical protein n=1 Tax=Microseira wollei TaxID=467598 RepID=UPI001CFEC7D3|nr:hypothetical protein [Microseira wollei]
MLVEKWEKVISNLPTHHITGNKIAALVEDNPQPPKKQKVDGITSVLGTGSAGSWNHP